LLFGALAAAGCPDRQATLSITQDGILVLGTACKPCAPRAEEGGIEPACACILPNHPPPELERRPMQARLFLVTPSDEKVRDASKCMTLLPCADAGRPTEAASCLAASVNQQLDGALPQGLTFDDLQNPDEVQLIMAFYQAVDSANVASCNRADLVACAGLAPPLGGGNYDISCASCQGGPKSAPGPDNGPCPRPNPRPDAGRLSGCFLENCDDILANNGY
jgi:hypothetical protein